MCTRNTLTRGILGFLFAIGLVSLAACGDKKKHHVQDEGLANIQPFISGTPYENNLKKCATAAKGQSCTLDQLPPISMEMEFPQISDVMARVLVSHGWMGDRFYQVLQNMPEDLLYMFGALTAIVIDDDVRPSYYNPATGAIYLDPDYLWLTPSERQVINPKEDFRGEYIRRMAYRPVWRYTDGQPSDPTFRSLETITLDMAQLLFHELAHANDIFPQSAYDTLDRSQQMEVVTNDLYNTFPSTRLTKEEPLASAMMFHLAGILYGGDNASSTDQSITAAQVGEYFAPDGANDDYNYSSQYEDVAMLFEEVMMKLHFDLDRDVGFVNSVNSQFCNDYIVDWGMRNRIGQDKVKERAQWVVAQLLPHRDYSAWFDTIPEPRHLPVNVGWCSSETMIDITTEKAFSQPSDDMTPINHRHFLPAGFLPNTP